MKEKTFFNQQVQLIHADCLEYLKQISDSSVDLIVTDPPYYKVAECGWDHQWDDEASYLKWLGCVFTELHRVLKPTGSIYLFCWNKLSADTEILMRQWFHVLNHIVWVKNSGRWGMNNKERQRSYYSANERILFAEHYGSDNHAKGCAGYQKACRDLRKHVFSPLIEYFRSARKSLKVSAKEIDEATGTQMCSHWFGYSQWSLPSRENYEKLQALFASKAAELGQPYDQLNHQYQTINADYHQLVRQYDELKVEYEQLRRPFFVSKEVQYTDTWHFNKVEYYPGKHPCEKPAAMLEHIIAASSRPGDIVLDVFMGSGSTGKAAIKLGREFTGIELEASTFQSTCASFSKLEEEWTQK